jgi:lipopolysaccharide biosynthesis regulator YciM
MITRNKFVNAVAVEANANTISSNTIINHHQQTTMLKKPARSRVDYNFSNYCSQCDLKLSKQTLRCPECRQKVRTRPWHRSKIIEFRRI